MGKFVAGVARFPGSGAVAPRCKRTHPLVEIKGAGMLSVLPALGRDSRSLRSGYLRQGVRCLNWRLGTYVVTSVEAGGDHT